MNLATAIQMAARTDDTYRLGTVVGVEPFTVTFDGGTTNTACVHLASYTPTANDYVLAVRAGVDCVLGAVGAPYGQTVFASVTPGGDLDASTSGSFVTWITFSNLIVPAWATTAFVTMSLTGIYDITAANNNYNMQTRIGADAGSPVIRLRGFGINARFSATWSTQIDMTATGSRSFAVNAARSSGTGQFRADTTSDATAIIRYT